ncbi:MAG: hypothetical protein RLZZ621_2653, partial [Gemmatimonadota bacterium]
MTASGNAALGGMAGVRGSWGVSPRKIHP